MEALKLNPNGGGTSEDDLPDKLVVARQKDVKVSLYEGLILSGIRVDRVNPGFLSCSFTVPRYLTNRDGNFANGAIANLVDELGGAVLRSYGGEHSKVSIDMSISLISPAKADDELEMISRVLGQNGRYSGTIVSLRNKKTGDVIAEGRHSLFGNFVNFPPTSPLGEILLFYTTTGTTFIEASQTSSVTRSHLLTVLPISSLKTSGSFILLLHKRVLKYCLQPQ